MDSKELNMNAQIYKEEHNLETLPVPIPKKDLVKGKTYKGVCRNSSKAVWNGEVFTYQRHKFGFVYDEDINHYEDDDGYDVFVPFEEEI